MIGCCDGWDCFTLAGSTGEPMNRKLHNRVRFLVISLMPRLQFLARAAHPLSPITTKTLVLSASRVDEQEHLRNLNSHSVRAHTITSHHASQLSTTKLGTFHECIDRSRLLEFRTHHRIDLPLKLFLFCATIDCRTQASPSLVSHASKI